MCQFHLCESSRGGEAHLFLELEEFSVPPVTSVLSVVIVARSIENVL